jgi:MoaA/NifB/PqqE/SkfB family radical SAM enzyme
MDKENRKILIYLTDKCNLNCRHCFLKASPLGKLNLTWIQIKKILDYYAAQDYHEITFSGGEAFISPHLKTAIDYAHAHGFDRIFVNTNGINQDIFHTFTPQDITRLIFSLDGLSSKTHEFIRGSNTFNRTLSSIKLAQKKGFEISVIVTVNSLNYSEIPQLVKFLDQIKVNMISFNYTSPRGNALQNQSLLITPKQWRKLYKAIITIQLEYSTLRIPPLFLTKREISLLKPTDIRCLIPEATKVEIYPDGKIFHCCLLSDYPELAAGKISQTEIKMQVNSENKLLHQYPQSFCPVQQYKLPNHSKNITSYIPICVYYKTLIQPKK